MVKYRYLNIPDTCKVENTIFKKLFYENADLSTNDKNLFINEISKITWVYCLKPETINILPYKDDIREYQEIEVIEVELLGDSKLRRIAEIIMRTIPYPMMLIFKLEDKVQIFVAHQRINQNDSSKNTIEEFISTDWLDSESSLFKKLDIKQMRFTNYYALYSDIVDAISIYNVSSIVSEKPILTGEEARRLSNNIDIIEQKIISLKSKLKKESQFNRKMEINIQIKKLEKERISMIGGFSK